MGSAASTVRRRPWPAWALLAGLLAIDTAPATSAPTAESWGEVDRSLQARGFQASRALADSVRAAHPASLALLVQFAELRIETDGVTSTVRALASLDPAPGSNALALARARVRWNQGINTAVDVDGIGDDAFDVWWAGLVSVGVRPLDDGAAIARDLDALSRSVPAPSAAVERALRIELALVRTRVLARFAPRDTTLGRIEKVIEVADRAGRPTTAARARLLYGRLLAAFGRTDDAIDVYRRAATELDAVGAVRSAAVARSYLGYTLESRSLYGDALRARRHAVATFSALEDSIALGHALLGLTWDLTKTGSTWRAVERGIQAVDVWNGIGDDWGRAQALNNLGVAYFALDRWDEARDAYDRARLVVDSSGNEVQEAMILDNLAALERRRMRPDRAVRLQSRLLEIHRARGDRDAEIRALNNLGLSCMTLGEIGQARTFYQRSIDLAEEHATVSVAGLQNLALLELSEERVERAEDLLWRSQRGARSHQDPRAEAEAWAWLAGVAVRRDDLEMATLRYVRADSLHRASNHVGNRAANLVRLAAVLALRGDHERARTVQARAESLSARLPAPSFVAVTRVHGAAVELAAGYPARARDRIRTAIDGLTDPFDSNHMAEERRVALSRAVEIFVAALRDVPTAERPELAEEAFALTLALQAAETGSIVGRDAITDSVDVARVDSLLQRERELRTEFERVRREGLVTAASDPLALAELETRLHATRREVARRSPARARGMAPVVPTIESLRAALDPRTLVLDFVLSGGSALGLVDTGAIFVLEADRPVRAFVLERREELGRQIQVWRDLLSRPTVDGDARAAEEAMALRLGEVLLGPVRDSISRHDRLVVVADGAVHDVPFSALRVTDARGKTKRLIETIAVQTVPSLALWSQVRGRPDTERAHPFDLVVCEDDERDRKELIARWARSTSVPPAALAPTYRGSLDPWRDARVLHVGTHGEFDASRPWRAGLYVAADSTISAPIVQAADLLATAVRGEVVVLASCSSARRGSGRRGAAFGGFSQALLHAGARAVVGTRWEIDEAVARWSSRRLYRALADGAPLADAVAGVQRELLAADTTRDPFHWATWTVVGDGALQVPLRTRSAPFTWAWWFASLAAGLLAWWLLRGRPTRRG